MDANAQKLLESATLRTLHAQNFSRSSSQASQVLTDLLSRYLTVLSTSCAKYAEQAGRLGLSVRDARCALEEMGVDIEELAEYCNTEGKESARHATQTRNRVEDLKEFKAVLADGLRPEYDRIPLVYAPLPSTSSRTNGVEYSEGETDTEDDDFEEEKGDVMLDGQDLDEAGVKGGIPLPVNHTRRPSTPPFPLSPVSNPASPARKRQRTLDWNPPLHVPHFLPPFPDDQPSPSPSRSPLPSQVVPPPSQHQSRTEQPPTPLLGSSSSSDYLTSVPYAVSSLSSMPEWHLPERISSPGSELSQARPFALPTPQTQPSLIAAYHHILTHPPPANAGAANPGRHRVAMALLSQAQVHPRWDPPDTLFSSIAPCPPRVSAITPSYPIQIGAPPVPNDSKGDKQFDQNKEKKANLPSAPPKPVASIDRITPMISQQSSRIPELARHILPSSVYTRTTRLTHPPVLLRGTQRLTYGPGLNAAWNSNPPIAAPTPPLGKAKDSSNGTPSPVLPDARYFATWDYEPKHFYEPLGVGKRGRTGSFQSTSTIGLGPNKRARGMSKMS